jgi:hypothetical protein
MQEYGPEVVIIPISFLTNTHEIPLNPALKIPIIFFLAFFILLCWVAFTKVFTIY